MEQGCIDPAPFVWGVRLWSDGRLPARIALQIASKSLHFFIQGKL